MCIFGLIDSFPFCYFWPSVSFFFQSQAAANYREEVRVFKKFHGNVIGRGGATLRKVNSLIWCCHISYVMPFFSSSDEKTQEV